MKEMIHLVGGTLRRTNSPKSPWGGIPHDPKTLAVVKLAMVHVYDVTKYEEVAGVGERIEAVLYTPLLSDELQVVYNVLGDGKNIHSDAADKDRRHIHLVRKDS